MVLAVLAMSNNGECCEHTQHSYECSELKEKITSTIEGSLTNLLEKKLDPDEIDRFKNKMNELMREIDNLKNELRDETDIYMNYCETAVEVVDDVSQYIKNQSEEFANKIRNKPLKKVHKWFFDKVLEMYPYETKDSSQATNSSQRTTDGQ